MKNSYPEKSPKWWFDNYLPEPYRSQAISNWNGANGKEHSLANAINGGFVWTETPEGFHYWLTIHKSAFKGEFNTTKP